MLGSKKDKSKAPNGSNVGNKKKLSELQLKTPDDDAEVIELRKRCEQEAPDQGTQIRSENKLRLDTLPISTRTKQALELAKFEVCTEIQAAAIPHALAGRDVLGAAKTGSGKTLAFVIPVIERLYTERWGREDGLAALVISPTRELAMQIFEVLRVVGKRHDLSAGLVTGGKKEYEGEQERIVSMNILVATPGRLLQHFEQTAGFDASQLLILVLDEADRILDMGFQEQLDGIISYLPSSRQTLLFSATQTKSVKALARLSLRDPEYVAVHDGADKEGKELGVAGGGQDSRLVTPSQLIQNYVVVKLPEKLDVLYAFLKSHLKSKIIVFFSTCSQVRYVFECFRGMQPGIPLTCLHGKIKQEKRSLVYLDFTRKKHACMLATDIAARGLDFPAVDWVIQVDAPEDVATYVHRVGRTARHTAGGRSLMLVMPTEEKPILAAMRARGIEAKKLTVNPKKTFSVAAQAASLLASAPEYRQLAKKAFTGYLRSLQLLPDKDRVQDVSQLPVDEFAQSLGLGFAPPLPQQPMATANSDLEEARSSARSAKNKNRALDKLRRQIKEAKLVKKINKMLKEQGIDPESDEGASLRNDILKEKAESEKLDVASGSGDQGGGFAPEPQEGSDSDGELFTVKAKTTTTEEAMETVESDLNASASSTKSAADARKKAEKEKQRALKITREGIAKTVAFETGDASRKRKVAFDEEGEAIAPVDPLQLMVQEKGGAVALSAANAETIADRMRRVKQKVDETRVADSQRERDRIRAKRLKEKSDKHKDEGDDGGAVLGSGSDSDDNHPRGRNGGSSSSDSSDSDSDSSSSSGGSDEEEASESDADPEALEQAALRKMNSKK